MEPKLKHDGPVVRDDRSRGAPGHGRLAKDGPVPDMVSEQRPSAFPRRIVVCVTGLSPQVVTETIYALTQAQHPPFVPTDIHLITTEEGADRARLSLLHPKTGWFHRLRRDYRLPPIHFAAGTIEVLCAADGRPLADIRSPDDNTRAADLITERVRELSADAGCALHVSIAGGRKTMGYYLGYALSLYGRPQDRLSHVLVSPPFESHPDFYYPTPESNVIYTPGPDSRPLDTREAKVTLADIPFVRLREGLPEELLTGRARFTEVVTEAQKALPPVAVVLDVARRAITAGGETFILKPADFAFYLMLAERQKKRLPGVHWSDANLAREILDYYGRITNPTSGDYEELEESLRCSGVTPSYFDPRKSNTNKAIRKALGHRRARPYLIARQERIPGTRYTRSGLTLGAAVITIVGP